MKVVFRKTATPGFKPLTISRIVAKCKCGNPVSQGKVNIYFFIFFIFFCGGRKTGHPARSQIETEPISAHVRAQDQTRVAPTTTTHEFLMSIASRRVSLAVPLYKCNRTRFCSYGTLSVITPRIQSLISSSVSLRSSV